jgi:hypothetical protein
LESLFKQSVPLRVTPSGQPVRAFNLSVIREANEQPIRTAARCQFSGDHPACEPGGDRIVKTESTPVQLDCFVAQHQRKLVSLLVWPFGVRKLISDEKYPESLDDE